MPRGVKQGGRSYLLNTVDKDKEITEEADTPKLVRYVMITKERINGIRNGLIRI